MTSKPANPKEPTGPTIAQLQAELDSSRRLMDSRVQALEAERDIEVKELIEFKEMASAHLRAQNLTIKRLSTGRGGGTVGAGYTVAHGIMNRVRTLAIENNKTGGTVAKDDRTRKLGAEARWGR